MTARVCHAPPNFRRHNKLKLLSTETSDFLKQIIFLQSLNLMFGSIAQTNLITNEKQTASDIRMEHGMSNGDTVTFKSERRVEDGRHQYISQGKKDGKCNNMLRKEL